MRETNYCNVKNIEKKNGSSELLMFLYLTTGALVVLVSFIRKEQTYTIIDLKSIIGTKRMFKMIKN